MKSTLRALAALSGPVPAQDPAFKLPLRPQVEMEFILVPRTTPWSACWNIGAAVVQRLLA
jgi:hypothetical protein